MQIISRGGPALGTLLKLGRVSNLPTVWTNVLTGTVLAAGAGAPWRMGLVILAMSLFYVGGMYLNDYYDRFVDARERPQRPIPGGEISESLVRAFGLAMLGIGVAAMAATGTAAAVLGAGLALAIVGYDIFHKGNPVAPVVMGLCRALVYFGAAAAASGGVPTEVMIAAVALLAYVAGLTYAARQESFDRVDNLWPVGVLAIPMLVALPAVGNGIVAAGIYAALAGCAAYGIYLLAARPMPGAVPRAVGVLIAGISLLDAALLAAAGAIEPALAAMFGFPATLMLQKYIPGT
jgi:4-hydroxybenzoate polyprenyltransferase